VTRIIKLAELYRKTPFTKKTVLVTGVFDVLHWAHKEFLDRAAQEGRLLLVGIESDQRVRQLKGPNRPVNPQQRRMENLKQLNIAEFIFTLPADFDQLETRKEFLSRIKPDILAVSESTPNLEQKKKLMQEIDGRVEIVFQHQPDTSTTKILQKN
jgi:D-beta-D-heptose 7-phosphate kinase/D-beta-D-heptose 1-phosphate adenosyltransferase